MNDLKKGKNYVVANGPVNRRTTQAPVVEKPQIAPAVRMRIDMAKSRHRLGAPLSHRLGGSTPGQGDGPALSPIAILQAMGATVGATGLVLGLLQGALLLSGAGAATLGVFACWAYVRRRSRRGDADRQLAPAGNVVEAEDLRRLDLAMERMAQEAPQATVEQLAQLKESIARCVALAAQEGSFLGHEPLYVREAVRRYIPDSIAACLKVPHKDRASLVIDGGKPAIDLLHDQLQMIQDQLTGSEASLTQSAGEALMRQQRFLAAKSNQPY